MTSCTMCAKDFPKEYKYCPLCGVPFDNESDPHYWGRKALTSRLSGEELLTSIEAIKKACELSPGNAHLLSGLGNLYYRAGELTPNKTGGCDTARHRGREGGRRHAILGESFLQRSRE